MRNLDYTVSILIACLFVLARAAAAASGETAPPTDLFSGLPAFLQSGEFMAGIAAGAVAVHLAHLVWHAGRQMLVHTFFLGQRTLHYGVAAALLGGLILLF